MPDDRTVSCPACRGEGHTGKPACPVSAHGETKVPDHLLNRCRVCLGHGTVHVYKSYLYTSRRLAEHEAGRLPQPQAA